ncbi:MAG: I78 family peptidase inhibitor [Burkholderiaceae bacterium]|nr:I78 family peptidase inhibitor [Burkholderiaceae bacterium]
MLKNAVLKGLLPALTVLAVLAGCASPGPATGPTGAPLGGTCNAGPAQSAVGKSSTAKVVEAARVSAGALMVRILRPGQMVTKEFDPERLNLEVDAAGRIIAARCG